MQIEGIMGYPSVSILLPVYNGERYLREAVESLLNQTYPHFELVILNDGSTDRTEEIILSYDDPRIVYVKNRANLGIVKTLNKGITLAKGEYIARMDADDIALPQRLEKQIDYLQADSDCDAVFTKIAKIDEASRRIGVWDADQQNVRHAQIVGALPQGNVLAHPTVMIRSELLKKYRYDYRAEGSEDYNLWLRLAADGCRLEKIEEELLLYRVHEDSITQQSIRGIAALKKECRARSYFLLERCRQRRCHSFERRVLKKVLHDGFTMMKMKIKRPLRKVVTGVGRLLWYVRPRTIPDGEILFVFGNADMGGAQRVQLALLEALKDYQSVTLFDSKSRDEHFLNRYRAYTTIRDLSVFSDAVLGRWLVSGYLQKMVEKSPVKVVFGSFSGLFYDIVAGIDTRKTLFVDLFHACDNNIEYYSLESLKRLDTRIVIDEKTRECLYRLYDKTGAEESAKEKTILVHNGVRVPDICPDKPEREALNLLFVGRDVPIKRVDIVRKTAKRMPEESFVLAGVSPHPDDPPNVSAAGETGDLAPYYTEANALLLASVREGFPMAVMEAMAYGVIPVCTDVGGISTHIRHGQNGFLIDPAQSEAMIVEDFVKILKRLKEDRALKARMSREAYAYARKHFDIRNFEATYRRLFGEWIKRK